MKYKLLYLVISLAIIIPGAISLARFGLNASIDFTGGTLWELTFEDHEIGDAQVNEALGEQGDLVNSVQQTDQSIILRAKPLSELQHQELKQKLEENIGALEEVRFESVGPTLGNELLRKTFYAVGLAAAVILLYVGRRFRNLKFGLAAIIAMFHDTFILLGSFSLLGVFYGIEVDTLFVTAVLTILSFSVHDTIVVFDRIRETTANHPKADFEHIVNKSVVETLGRSVNNSMTIIFMLLALFLLGGESIKLFVLALLIGTVSGTYSSTFTAAPLLVLLDKLTRKR